MELLPPDTHLKIKRYLYYQTYGGSHTFIVRLKCPINKKMYIKNYNFNNYDSNEEAYNDAEDGLQKILERRDKGLPLHYISIN